MLEDPQAWCSICRMSSQHHQHQRNILMIMMMMIQMTTVAIGGTDHQDLIDRGPNTHCHRPDGRLGDPDLRRHCAAKVSQATGHTQPGRDSDHGARMARGLAGRQRSLRRHSCSCAVLRLSGYASSTDWLTAMQASKRTRERERERERE